MTATANIPNETKRFTRDGSEALEIRLAKSCERVALDVSSIVPRDKLEALVLGGGYGRGEGGVLKQGEREKPYNDLEFYVFVRGNNVLNDRRYRGRLSSLGDRLSPEAGLHVEFKIFSSEKLRRMPVTMFTYDLVVGHRVVFGSESVFAGCEHHNAAEKIPLHEATRLLLNRCTGLLFSEVLLAKPALTPEDADFIWRNTAKAQLALGDVVLTVFGQYHWSVIQRRVRLEKLDTDEVLPWLTDVWRHHSEGTEFKLHPRSTPPPGEDVRKKLREVSILTQLLWVWLENRRLGKKFKTVRDYALDAGNKCPETFPAKNWLLNLRSFGAKLLWSPSIARYPRERLLRSLPLLLWHAKEADDQVVGACLRDQLITGETEWRSLIGRYTQIWRQYS
jgi:hypothetical protein